MKDYLKRRDFLKCVAISLILKSCGRIDMTVPPLDGQVLANIYCLWDLPENHTIYADIYAKTKGVESKSSVSGSILDGNCLEATLIHVPSSGLCEIGCDARLESPTETFTFESLRQRVQVNKYPPMKIVNFYLEKK